jgi:hypothetical protein
MATYTYEITACNPSELSQSSSAAGLTPISRIDVVGTSVTVHFTNALTTEQQEILAGIIDTHELDVSKNNKHTAINEFRSNRLCGGYTDGSDRKWGTLPTDITNLSGVCILIALGVVTEAQTWRDFGNTNHTMTPAQLVQLAAELAVFVRTCYEVSWYHKTQLAALETVEDVQEYDITTGWPS